MEVPFRRIIHARVKDFFVGGIIMQKITLTKLMDIEILHYSMFDVSFIATVYFSVYAMCINEEV